MKENRHSRRFPLGRIELLEGRALLSHAPHAIPQPPATVAGATDTPWSTGQGSQAWNVSAVAAPPAAAPPAAPAGIAPDPGTPQPAGSMIPAMNESSFKAITAGRFADGRLSLWAVDGDGNVWGRSTTGPDPASGWSDWQKEATPAPLQKIAVAQLADGRLGMWGIDRSGALWSQKQPSVQASSGWGPWQKMETPTALRGGTVAALSDGRLEMWSVGGDGSLWTQTQDSIDLLSTWSTWTKVGTPTPLKDIAAGYSDGRLTLYAVDQDNVPLTSQKGSNDPGAPLGAWTYWKQNSEPVGSIVTGRLSSDVLQVWGVDARTGLLDSGYVQSGMIGPIWGKTLGPASPAPAPTQDVTTGQMADGRLQVWTSGGDGSLWTETQVAPGARAAWSGWQKVTTGFSLPTPPPPAPTPPPPPPVTPTPAPTPTPPAPPAPPAPAPTPPTAPTPPPPTPTPPTPTPTPPPPAPAPAPAPTPPPAPTSPPAPPQPPTPPSPAPTPPPQSSQPGTTKGSSDAPSPIAASAATTTAPPTPPYVVGVQAVHTRRRGLTAVVVTFSEAMDPAKVLDLGAYQLTTMSRGRRSHPLPVGIAVATYNPMTDAVTLSLSRPFRRGRLTLTVAGGAVAAQNGAPLTSPFASPVV